MQCVCLHNLNFCELKKIFVTCNLTFDTNKNSGTINLLKLRFFLVQNCVSKLRKWSFRTIACSFFQFQPHVIHRLSGFRLATGDL